MLVKISGVKTLSDYTEVEAEKIKIDLTFKNAKYEDAVKFSRYPVKNIPEVIKYYEEKDGEIKVPIGYNIIFPYELVEDNSLSFGNIRYPKFNLKLRDIQKEAFNSYTGTKGIIVLQTGVGKSILGMALASKLKERVLIIAHKEDILDGWKCDAELCFNNIEVGLVKGKVFNIGKQITLTTIQTLSALPEDKIAELNEKISMVICDECHRVGGNSYKVLNELRARYRLGLTATDDRNDGLRKALDLLLGEVIYRSREGEVEEILNDIEVKVHIKESGVTWRSPTEYFYLDTFKYVKDFYNETEKRDIKKYSEEWFKICKRLVAEGKVKKRVLDIQEAFKVIRSNEDFNTMVLFDIINEVRQGNPCLVLCREKEQIRVLDTLLHREKIRDAILYYGDSKLEKGEMKEIAESKRSLVTLATLAIATEGTNVKAWSRIFLVSSIANKKDLTQAVGRGRRRVNGKDDLVIYDYRHPKVDGVSNHGSIRDELYKELKFTVDKL